MVHRPPALSLLIINSEKDNYIWKYFRHKMNIKPTPILKKLEKDIDIFPESCFLKH